MTTITIDTAKCTGCLKCTGSCTGIFTPSNTGVPAVKNAHHCIGCGHCVSVCPKNAIRHSDIDRTKLKEARPNVVEADDAELMLSSRRSCRAFKKELPSREDLDRLFRVATQAPSGFNCQDRSFVVITDPEILDALRRDLLKETRKNIRLLTLLSKRPMSFLFPKETVNFCKAIARDMRAIVSRVERGEDGFFCGAPAVVLFTGVAKDPHGKDHALLAMSYFMTQAQAMGYGTCINGFVQQAPKTVAKYVRLPKFHRAFGAITLGKPARTFHRTVLRKAAVVEWVGDLPSRSSSTKEKDAA